MKIERPLIFGVAFLIIINSSVYNCTIQKSIGAKRKHTATKFTAAWTAYTMYQQRFLLWVKKNRKAIQNKLWRFKVVILFKRTMPGEATNNRTKTQKPFLRVHSAFQSNNNQEVLWSSVLSMQNMYQWV